MASAGYVPQKSLFASTSSSWDPLQRSRLSLRYVVRAILIGTCVAGLITCVQLALFFRSDIAQVPRVDPAGVSQPLAGVGRINGVEFSQMQGPGDLDMPLGDLPVIKVTNNGIGIPARFRERAFEMFECLHAQTTDGGAAFGLTACNRIAGPHGGTISPAPGIDSGTTGVVTLQEVNHV